jgi:hypothetical protein
MFDYYGAMTIATRISVRELTDVVVTDLGAVSDGDAMDRIADLERSINALQARQLVEIVAYTARRRRADIANGAPSDQAGRRATTEVALARRVSTATVNYQVTFGNLVVIDHPRLTAAALEGEVSLASLRRVTEETCLLDAERRWLVDEQLVETLGDETVTPAQLARAARRRALAADPDAARKREEAARARRAVTFRPLPDGVASLAAELPAEQAAACWNALDSHARGLRGDGDHRSLTRIMCDTFVERLTQQVAPPAHRAAREQPVVDVGIVIAASSLLGADDEPAQLVGYGAISAGLARQLASGPSVFGRRLVCDPCTGELIDSDTRRRLFDGPLRTFIQTADQTCRRPGCESPIREIDHLQEHSRNGPTSGANGTGYCRADHGTKHAPGWDVRRTPDWAVARPMWQPPPPFDWTRRRKSGLPDRAHGIRHLTHSNVAGDSAGEPGGFATQDGPAGDDGSLPSRRPSITWTTPTGHAYVSPPPPVLGHGSVPVPDTVEKATRRLDSALERMAGHEEHGGVDLGFDDVGDANALPADLWRGNAAAAELDALLDLLPPAEYIDSQAWLEALEREAEIELMPCS